MVLEQIAIIWDFLAVGIETVWVVYNLEAMEVVYQWEVLEWLGLKNALMGLKFVHFLMIKSCVQ